MELDYSKDHRCDKLGKAILSADSYQTDIVDLILKMKRYSMIPTMTMLERNMNRKTTKHK